MNSLWNTLYDPVKDRRYGALFLLTMAIFFGLGILGVFVRAALNDWEIGMEDLLRALPGIFILITALIWRKIRRSRTMRKEKYKFHELSRDEIRKARSKLMKVKN